MLGISWDGSTPRTLGRVSTAFHPEEKPENTKPPTHPPKKKKQKISKSQAQASSGLVLPSIAGGRVRLRVPKGGAARVEAGALLLHQADVHLGGVRTHSSATPTTGSKGRKRRSKEISRPQGIEGSNSANLFEHMLAGISSASAQGAGKSVGPVDPEIV